MKIEHLLEMPTKAIPQAAANLKQKRLDRAQPKPATVGQTVIPDVNNPDVSMAKTNPQPTTTAAPAQDAGSNYGQGTPTSNTPAADASGRVEPTMEPDELADIRKNAGLPAAQEPEQLQGTVADEEPAAPKKSFMQKVGNAAQSVSNVIQKGAANAADNIPGITDYAGKLAKDVQPGLSQVAQSTGQLTKDVGGAVGDVGTGVKSAGQGVADAGQGVSNAAQGIGHGVGGIGQGIGHAATGIAKGVQGIGDLAGAVGTAVTSPLGGLVGGLKRGYTNATKGVGNAGSDAIAGAMNQRSRSNGGSSGGGNQSNDEIAQLQSTIQQMDQRLRKGGL